MYLYKYWHPHNMLFTHQGLWTWRLVSVSTEMEIICLVGPDPDERTSCHWLDQNWCCWVSVISWYRVHWPCKNWTADQTEQLIDLSQTLPESLYLGYADSSRESGKLHLPPSLLWICDVLVLRSGLRRTLRAVSRTTFTKLLGNSIFHN